MGLLALAIAPGIAICLYIYFKDKYNREPRKYLLLSFFLGMVSTIPAIFIELYGGKLLELNVEAGYLFTAISAFAVVAFTEEFCKFAMVRIFAYPRQAFDDPFDGIIYTVMVGMGFATLENIFYVLEHGYIVGVMRLLFSVPGHAAFAVIMGYYIGLAKFRGHNSLGYMLLGIFWATFFHGFYDFFLFINTEWYHIIGALVSFIVAVRFALIAFKRKQAMSKLHFETKVIKDLGPVN